MPIYLPLVSRAQLPMLAVDVMLILIASALLMGSISFQEFVLISKIYISTPLSFRVSIPFPLMTTDERFDPELRSVVGVSNLNRHSAVPLSGAGT